MEMNDDVLISYLLGEANSEQITATEQWRDENLANRQYFDQFKQIWEAGMQLKFDGEPDPHASLLRLKEKVNARRPGNVKVFSLHKKYSWLKIAAVLFVVSAGAWMYAHFVYIREIRFETREIVRADTLSDGSVVTLNKYSQLNYPQQFKTARREVWLTKGEAFFKVTANKTKPFLIRAGGTTIKVVGTSFNVKNKGGNIEVIVETGLVQVSKNAQMILLKPGEKVQVKQSNAHLIREQNPDLLYRYYRSKEFVADNTPLLRMVQVLNEAYGSHIIIGRKELNTLPLNATFKNESLDNVLEIISHTFNLKIERRPDQIILY